MKRMITVQFVKTEVVEVQVVVEGKDTIDAEKNWLSAYEEVLYRIRKRV